MFDEMSDISQFCEFEKFEWVMFWDKTAPYPNGHLDWIDTWAQA